MCTTQTAVIRCATRAHTERTHNRTRVLFLAMTVMCHYGGDVMHLLLWRGGARARLQRRPMEVQFYVDFFKNCVSTIRPSLPPAAGADAQSNTRSNFINDRDRCVMVRGDANDFSALASVEEFFSIVFLNFCFLCAPSPLRHARSHRADAQSNTRFICGYDSNVSSWRRRHVFSALAWMRPRPLAALNEIRFDLF